MTSISFVFFSFHFLSPINGNVVPRTFAEVPERSSNVVSRTFAEVPERSSNVVSRTFAEVPERSRHQGIVDNADDATIKYLVNVRRGVACGPP